MKRYVFLSISILATFLAGLSTASSAQTLQVSGASRIDIAYSEPTSSALRPAYDRLRKRRVLEQMQQFLSPLRLPRRLEIRTEQCDAPSHPYKSGGAVLICYEHVEKVRQLASKQPSQSAARREGMIVGAFVQGMLHNVAHAIFDTLELPVWGRANDAADQLAAFMMLQFGEDVALTTILGTARFFAATERNWAGEDFADTASPEAQRAYNFLCIAFGSDPEAFKFLVEEKLLPLRRAQRCPGEHGELQFAFMNQIIPHVDREQIGKIQGMQILRPDEIERPAQQTKRGQARTTSR